MEGSAKKRRICENDEIARGASCSHTSTEGHGTTISPGRDYEVFLSFRGPDTREGFTDFLYTSLIDAGIRAFKDDEDLRIGEGFAPELLQAIKQSKISIPIFSKGYASSAWCLKELVQMVERKKSGGQKIMPIFYDVAPLEVRHQTGGYEEAFRSHVSKKRYDEKTVSQWKATLEEVSFLNGWDLHSMPNRREGEFARKLTQKVFSELKKAYLVVSNCLANVDNHAYAIMKMIGAGTCETRIIGIHGMGGIGKTTIAKVIYNKLSHDFENCCFLGDIRERSKGNGIQCLQNQLICRILKTKCMDIKDTDEATQTIKDRLSYKRVLLLLDDVEEENHIDALVGKRDWLGKGSKIIITTRNKDILEVPEVDCSYELSCMDPVASLQLFSKHAFRKDYPSDEYIDQSKRVIAIAGGLPLTLEVIGSLLCRTKKEKWDITLRKLENVPHATVQSKLRISYDALDIRQQHIFLDIACLLIGYDKDIVVHFWDASKYPEDAMEVLHNMSLIKITMDNRVWMHDQLRDLGREIVRQKSEMKIEKQSRVWDPKEGLDLLGKHKGNKEVEALCVKLDYWQQYCLTYEGFESLSNLRFLQMDGWMVPSCAEKRLLWHESPSNVLPANFFEENSKLLPQLRWLSWHHIPPTFKITHFSLEDMVFLDLSYSEITHNWKGWSHTKVMKNLKVLNLSYCEYLERTPNFSAHASLERLILIGCRRLVKIDGSVCQLKRLAFLNVYGCERLQRLPDEIGNLESLIKLDIAGTSIEELPDSIGNLKNLRIPKMRYTRIRKTLNVLWRMEKLEEIELSNFDGDSENVNIDNCIYRNQSLKILKLEEFKIYAVPKLPESLVTLCLHKLYTDTFPDLSNLTNLQELDLEFGSRDSHEESNGPLEEYPIPRWMGNLSKLKSLRLESPCVTTSPADLTLPPQLKSLYLKCPSLRLLPRLPSSLYSLYLFNCRSLCSMESLDLSSPYVTTSPTELTLLPPHLKELHLEYCTNLRRLPRLPSSLFSLRLEHCDSLCSMESLWLNSPYVTTSPIDLTLPPPHLKELHLNYCRNLHRLPRLPIGSFSLCLEHCDSLSSMESLDLSMDTLPPHLKSLYLEYCTNLCPLPRLPSSLSSLYPYSKLESLCSTESLNLSSSNVTTSPTDLTLPPLHLKKLYLYACPNLRCLPRLPSSLSSLHLYECKSLCSMEDLSNLKNLSSLSIGDSAIEEIQGLGCLENLQHLNLWWLEQVKILPDLSNLNNLRRLEVKYCRNLVEIQGELPPFLDKLRIYRCDSLQNLPDLSSLMGNEEVEIKICSKLHVDAILGFARINPRDLRLSGFGQLQILPDLSNSSELTRLEVHGCHNLIEIQGELPKSLEVLKISSCDSLQNLPDLSSLMGKQEVEIQYCSKLNVEAILGFARINPRDLQLLGFGQLQILPDLSNSSKLRSLEVRDCPNLVEIQGELPESLEKLEIDSCESLQKLPDLSSFMGKVHITGCWKLNLGEDDEFESEFESDGEDDEDEFESEGEDNEIESESEGEDHKSEYEI